MYFLICFAIACVSTFYFYRMDLGIRRLDLYMEYREGYSGHSHYILHHHLCFSSIYLPQNYSSKSGHGGMIIIAGAPTASLSLRTNSNRFSNSCVFSAAELTRT